MDVAGYVRGYRDCCVGKGVDAWKQDLDVNMLAHGNLFVRKLAVLRSIDT